MDIKRFFEWIGLKKKLHYEPQDIPLVREGELWWASLGENIGFEMNGKSKDFTRPVFIYKKLTDTFYFVIPTSTQLRHGSWYVSFKLKQVMETACLQQARTIDYRRLHSKLGEVSDLELQKIREGFRKLYL